MITKVNIINCIVIVYDIYSNLIGTNEVNRSGLSRGRVIEKKTKFQAILNVCYRS